ncbi:MAG: hypothetical protein AMXMBFR47_45740 [Planctomycetota bacterium]
MPVRLSTLVLASMSFAGLVGCGENPSPKHGGDDATPGVVRGAALDGSDDPIPPQPSVTAAVNSGGGVPTLPPDEPVAAAPKSPAEVPSGELVGPVMNADIRQAPVAAAAATPAGTGQKQLPSGPLGKPDPDRPDHLRLIFNELASFDYDPFEVGVPSLGSSEPQPAGEKLEKNAQIPKQILELNGKKVSVAGFMVPIEIKKDQAKSFLLVRNQMLCCFGVQIGFNEWIFVEMEGDRRATFVPDVLVWVYGTLDVGEDVQDGMVMSIYRMKAGEVVHEGGK